MERILITGATGHLGTAVIERLLTNLTAGQISILTRNYQKVKEFEVKGFLAFCGSYADVKSLEHAMQGVDTVLLISSGDQGDRMQEHRNVIDTAVRMGVKHIAYTSRCMKDRNSLENRLMEEHFATEDLIIKTRLKYTFFRNVLYMDAIPQFTGGNMALERGIFLPAGDGRVSFVLRAEMGEAMANVLLTNADGNHIYHFTGRESVSFYDIANALSELSGREVKYTDVEKTTFANMMKTRHLPEAVIQKIIDFITDIKNDQEAEVFSDLDEELGRKSTGLKDGLKLVFEI